MDDQTRLRWCYGLLALSAVDSQIIPWNVILFPVTFGTGMWFGWKATR